MRRTRTLTTIDFDQIKDKNLYEESDFEKELKGLVEKYEH